VILEVGGIEVRTIDSLLARLRPYRAGDVVPIRILRGDAETTMNVTMGLLTP
jgi:S1-C subfamily serine protease